MDGSCCLLVEGCEPDYTLGESLWIGKAEFGGRGYGLVDCFVGVLEARIAR